MIKYRKHTINNDFFISFDKKVVSLCSTTASTTTFHNTCNYIISFIKYFNNPVYYFLTLALSKFNF